MAKYIILICLLGLCGGLLYQLGKKQCQTQILTSQQEKTHNVSLQKAKIYAQPNVSRDALLELMQNNIL